MREGQKAVLRRVDYGVYYFISAYNDIFFLGLPIERQTFSSKIHDPS